MVLEQIIQKAVELSLPEFLKWLIASGVVGKLTIPQVKKLYEILRTKHNKALFGFFPDKEEVYTLKRLVNKSIYKDFLRVLPGHWGTDVIRTACYVLILEEKKEKEKIEVIKTQVFKNKKLLGLRLVEMVQAGVIKAVLERLIMLKDKHNYENADLANEFENLLNDWRKITIFVQNEDSVEKIKDLSKKFIDKREETFFILAKGNATETAVSTIVELQKEKYLIEKGYVWFARSDHDTHPPTYYCGVHSSDFLL